MSRAARRALGGKRKLQRDAHRAVVRIIELHDQGRSPSAIASSMGLTEEFVLGVLERAEEIRDHEDLERAGGGG